MQLLEKQPFPEDHVKTYFIISDTDHTPRRLDFEQQLGVFFTTVLVLSDIQSTTF